MACERIPVLCENCRYFKPYNNEDCTGECRRNAPRPVTVSDTEEKYAVWPEVHESLWCGEFEASGKVRSSANAGDTRCR